VILTDGCPIRVRKTRSWELAESVNQPDSAFVVNKGRARLATLLLSPNLQWIITFELGRQEKRPAGKQTP
jgi:hypothetical protein